MAEPLVTTYNVTLIIKEKRRTLLLSFTVAVVVFFYLFIFFQREGKNVLVFYDFFLLFKVVCLRQLCYWSALPVLSKCFQISARLLPQLLHKINATNLPVGEMTHHDANFASCRQFRVFFCCFFFFLIACVSFFVFFFFLHTNATSLGHQH